MSDERKLPSTEPSPPTDVQDPFTSAAEPLLPTLGATQPPPPEEPLQLDRSRPDLVRQQVQVVLQAGKDDPETKPALLRRLTEESDAAMERVERKRLVLSQRMQEVEKQKEMVKKAVVDAVDGEGG